MMNDHHQDEAAAAAAAAAALPRAVVLHRITMERRSFSLTDSPRRTKFTSVGWRSVISKWMRTQSTTTSSNGGGAVASPAYPLTPLNTLSGSAGCETPAAACCGDASQPNLTTSAHCFDICVIQATPANSPCNSVKTLASSSSSGGGGGGGGGEKFANLSVTDRRRRFAVTRAKGADDDGGALSLFGANEIVETIASSAATLQLPGPVAPPRTATTRTRSFSLQTDWERQRPMNKPVVHQSSIVELHTHI